MFPSNWELSTSRATNVLRYLLAEARLSPQRLSAVGYSEYRPVVSNDTREGRGLNRRVDIVILSTIAEFQEPKPGLEETDGLDAEQTGALEPIVPAGTQQPAP
jgi:chemotaxis protein MotB